MFHPAEIIVDDGWVEERKRRREGGHMLEELRRRMTFDRDFTDALRWSGFENLAAGVGMTPDILAFFEVKPAKWDYRLLGWIHRAESETSLRRGKVSRLRGSAAAAEHVMRVLWLYRQKTGDNQRHLEFAAVVSEACALTNIEPDDFWRVEVDRYRKGRRKFFAGKT